MYLVLTAMLALNVSADIINGFSKLRHSMESSVKSTYSRTEDIMKIFEAAYSKDDAGKAKYGEWYAVAKAIHTESQAFYDYIEAFKLDIANMVDGRSGDKRYTSMPERLIGGSDTNKPHQYALVERGESGKLHAEEFEDKMDAYRDFMTTNESPCILAKMKDDKFAHDMKVKQDMFLQLFNTDEVQDEEGNTIGWAQSVFHEMPAAAVTALLTKYQNDIRVAENDMVNFMFASAGSSDFVVNSVEALVMPTNGEYIMQGQRYRAKIVSAMVDTNQVPRVFINGHEIENGVYEVAAGSVGPQTYSGYMLIGDDTTHYQFKGQYTVGAPSATLSNLDLNIIYKGYDNPFSISVPGVSSEKIHVSCPGASVSKNGANWIIKPGDGVGGTTTIEVSAEVDGKVISMGSQTYRVKNLPRPDAYFEINGQPTEETKVARSALINPSNRIIASYGADGLIQAKFRITGFQVKMPTGASIAVKGDKFDQKSLDAIKKLKQGNMVNIQYIKAIGPDGKEVQLRPLPIELN